MLNRPAAPAATQPVSVPDVVGLLQLLQHLLATEPGWDKPLTQERLFDLLQLAAQRLQEGSC